MPLFPGQFLLFPAQGSEWWRPAASPGLAPGMGECGGKPQKISELRFFTVREPHSRFERDLQ
jgi:hypothetical protein